VRRERGVPEDPIAALKASDYPAQVVLQRAAVIGGDSGFPGA
jgi:L-rhamnose isomerase